MNTPPLSPRSLSFVALLSLCGLISGVAAAQAAQPLLIAQPMAAASAPVPRRAPPPGPRLLTPEEARDQGRPPEDDVRPEGTVVPQIQIPLGTPVTEPAKPLMRAPRPGKPASAPRGIDDAAARCEALTSAAARAQCRDAPPAPARMP